MRWLRMFFRHKIKIYVEVDEMLRPVEDESGHIRYRYRNSAGAADYKTTRAALTMIPGAEPEDEGEETLSVKVPKVHKTAQERVAQTPICELLPPDTIVIYTDGGASPNPGPAGSAALLAYAGHTLEIWEYMERSTNNVAELRAIQRGLEAVRNKEKTIMLYSDSAYAIGVLTGRMKATKNLELIAQVKQEMAKCPRLQLLKVKAHVGIAYNEHVDRLVALARDTRKSGERRT